MTEWLSGVVQKIELLNLWLSDPKPTRVMQQTKFFTGTRNQTGAPRAQGPASYSLGYPHYPPLMLILHEGLGYSFKM